MSRPLNRCGLLLWSVLLPTAGCFSTGEKIGPVDGYALVAGEMERVIAREMEKKAIPAISIVLADGLRIVWARGFGFADPEKKLPATAETVYRVGSVSKLFTDIAIVREVERGALDLDAPVTRYLADFRPQGSPARPITLRQLMAHRSGIVREPPRGSYFDAEPRSLEETVASLNSTAIVYEPETRTKYSNAGISVAGLVLQRLHRRPFEQFIRETLLDPLRLDDSGFEATSRVRSGLARASMWGYYGQPVPAPTFLLGTGPAGNLYSTATDLGRFLVFLLGGGQGPSSRILARESLEAMWTPQFVAAGEKSGFGLGFVVSEFDGPDAVRHRAVGHGGAVYGFSTDVIALPDAGLGAAAMASLDVTNTVVERITRHALLLLLARRSGKPFPAWKETAPVDPALARRIEGRYGLQGSTVELIERRGGLFLNHQGLVAALGSAGGALVTDDRHAYGLKVIPGADRIDIGGKTYEKLAAGLPAAPPPGWKGLLGEYGWDHNPLLILEREGKLHALIEWIFLYPLAESSPDVFAFPDWGLYHGEKLLFTRGADGVATRVEAASVVFPRRTWGESMGGESGSGTFRIRPVRPMAELRELARAASPPEEKGEFAPAELLGLGGLEPTLRFDVRYATSNNFLGEPLYSQAAAFLVRPAAEALLRSHRSLQEKGFGLLIHDAYRPWEVTKIFYEATPPKDRHFVADPNKGSRHNRGAAVDLTLCDLKTGEPVEMVGLYDEMSPRSNPDYPGGTSLQRWYRDTLREAMEAQGFQVYEHEWWHFDFQGWERFPIQNVPFEKILSR